MATGLCHAEPGTSGIGPPPANYKEKIRALFNRAVPEKLTATYEFDSPQVEKIWRGLIRGGNQNYWVVHFRMTTKQPNGELAGPARCTAVFDRSGEISLDLTEPPNAASLLLLSGDYARIQGRWVVFRCERDGAGMFGRKGHSFTYEGKRVRLDAGQGGEKYVLHEETTPKSVDFIDSRNPPVLGIYKFEDDTLITCTADPGRPRPTSFSTSPRDGRILTYTRRAK